MNHESGKIDAPHERQERHQRLSGIAWQLKGLRGEKGKGKRKRRKQVGKGHQRTKGHFHKTSRRLPEESGGVE